LGRSCAPFFIPAADEPVSHDSVCPRSRTIRRQINRFGQRLLVLDPFMRDDAIELSVVGRVEPPPAWDSLLDSRQMS